MEDQKQAVIRAIDSFVNQRPNMSYADYASIADYRRDYSRVHNYKNQAYELLWEVMRRGTITDKDLKEAAYYSYGGRVSFVENDDGTISVDYTPCKYWSTEYRAAICCVLATALRLQWYKEGKDPKQMARKSLRSKTARTWFR